MKHYTSTIPHDLAERLKEKGMPKVEGKDYFREPSYAEVFDWLIDLGYDVEFYLYMIKTSKDGTIQRLYAWVIRSSENCYELSSKMQEYYTWHEAANAAIEKALTLI